MGSELIEAARVSKSQSSSSSSGKFFPPGFRFHPTDEELVLFYLKRKICRRPLKPDIISEVDVYKWDPEELPGQSKLKTGDRQWFFFSPRDRKYPNGGRSSRATLHGYWKATGKDRTIRRNSCPVGIKKTLVYYQGRAPSGQRTDWVMHEYTMDEQELKRCQSAQEHYALNKIFKKSGPGPKNGEQYGAPFVEEEWADDDCLDVEPLLVQKPDCLDIEPLLVQKPDCLDIEPLLVQKPEPTRVDDSIIVREEEDMMLSSDILEFLNKIFDEPQILPPLPHINGGSHEQETPNSLLGCSSSNVDAVGQKTPTESSNVPQPLVFNGDFLEMDDLIDPQPVSRVEDLQFPEFHCLSEFEFYHDSTRFSESGTFGTKEFQSDDLDYRTENSGSVSEVVNHHHEVHDELPMSYDLWDHNHSSLKTAQAAHKAVSQSSSGVVGEENPGEHESRVNQHCLEANMDGGTDSWFSSALWAFVDSVPTTPASASESSALLNRALERMSSFSRGRNLNIAAAATATAAGGGGVKPSSVSRSRRGIVYFSVLGVLFAILWVFVGTSIELLQGLVS